MKEKLMIIGEGGHGKVCFEIGSLCGYKKILFLDDRPQIDDNYVGFANAFKSYLDEYDFFVAIGDNELRKSFLKKIISSNGTVAKLIHPNSIISNSATIGAGTVVMAGAVINADSRIGKGVIVNTASSIDHDCVINDYCHISVGSHVAGSVTIGDEVFVGAGSTVINSISICDKCVIGAGAVVIKDISQSGTYVGCPAQKIK